MKNSLRPPVDKSDIHFTLLVGACLWVKENNIQLNEKWMQSSLKCRQSVVNSFFFFFLPSRSTISSGPSPRSRYTARSGTTWLSPSPRQSATSRTMSPSTPGSSRCQSSLFTYSVSSRPLATRLSSELCQWSVSTWWCCCCLDATAVSDGFSGVYAADREICAFMSGVFCGAVSYCCGCDVSPTGSELSKPDLCLVLFNLFKKWSITMFVYKSFQVEKPSKKLFNSTIVTCLISNSTLETRLPGLATDERKSQLEFCLKLEVSPRCWCCMHVKATLYIQ